MRTNPIGEDKSIVNPKTRVFHFLFQVDNKGSKCIQ